MPQQTLLQQPANIIYFIHDLILPRVTYTTHKTALIHPKCYYDGKEPDSLTREDKLLLCVLNNKLKDLKKELSFLAKTWPEPRLAMVIEKLVTPACLLKHFDILSYLIKDLGASPNAKANFTSDFITHGNAHDDNEYAIHHAIISQTPSFPIRWDYSYKREQVYTINLPRFKPDYKNMYRCVELLIDSGANLNPSHCQPILEDFFKAFAQLQDFSYEKLSFYQGKFYENYDYEKHSKTAKIQFEFHRQERDYWQYAIKTFALLIQHGAEVPTDLYADGVCNWPACTRFLMLADRVIRTLPKDQQVELQQAVASTIHVWEIKKINFAKIYVDSKQAIVWAREKKYWPIVNALLGTDADHKPKDNQPTVDDKKPSSREECLSPLPLTQHERNKKLNSLLTNSLCRPKEMKREKKYEVSSFSDSKKCITELRKIHQLIRARAECEPSLVKVFGDILIKSQAILYYHNKKTQTDLLNIIAEIADYFIVHGYDADTAFTDINHREFESHLDWAIENDYKPLAIVFAYKAKEIKFATLVHTVTQERYAYLQFLGRYTDLKATDSKGRNLLHIIARSSFPFHSSKQLIDTLTYLIHTIGVDYRAVDDEGLTPLHYAERAIVTANKEKYSPMLNAFKAVMSQPKTTSHAKLASRLYPHSSATNEHHAKTKHCTSELYPECDATSAHHAKTKQRTSGLYPESDTKPAKSNTAANPYLNQTEELFGAKTPETDHSTHYQYDSADFPPSSYPSADGQYWSSSYGKPPQDETNSHQGHTQSKSTYAKTHEHTKHPVYFKPEIVTPSAPPSDIDANTPSPTAPPATPSFENVDDEVAYILRNKPKNTSTHGSFHSVATA